MMKTYIATKTFWIGEINKGLKVADELQFDDEKNILILNGQIYEVRNLKATIKTGWLVTKDGSIPVTDGPLGETAVEAADRKRKERFSELAKIEQERELRISKTGCIDEDNVPEAFINALGVVAAKKFSRNVIADDSKVVAKKLVADSREISRFVGGCVDEEKEPTKFVSSLGLENKSNKPDIKMTLEVVDHEGLVIKRTDFSEGAEVKAIKKALNQNVEEKKDPKEFKMFKDQYDAETVNIGKYTALNKENTIRTWSQLHWTKKEEIIKTADKDFLKEIKNVENSEKIIKRIEKRLETN